MASIPSSSLEQRKEGRKGGELVKKFVFFFLGGGGFGVGFVFLFFVLVD